MRDFDEAMIDRIEQAVGDLEDCCTLEVVVRIAPQSDAYREVPLAWALIGGLATLATMLFGPATVSALWVIPEVVAVSALAAWLGRGTGGTRLLTRRPRRAAAAEEAARACFVVQAVSGTRERTGVLVYTSVLEDLVVVLPDHGAEGAAPGAEWATISQLGRPGPAAADLPDRLLAILTALGSLGAAHLPVGEGDDNPDELPNRPVVGA